jgi:hypothetical protein
MEEAHFKLLTRLYLSCHFLASGQHTCRNHHDKVAAIVVKLFDQTLPAYVEMLYIKETVFGALVFGVPDRRLWTARTHIPSHWLPHHTGRHMATAPAT